MRKLPQKLNRLRDDERAVSPVVGFVLIFALIMIVFTIYQSSVVPTQNEEVEFKHSQTVEGQMSRLNDAIQQAGASAVPRSVTIDTGVQYPDRAFAINPGSPVGTLETVDAPNVTLSGLSDDSGYWRGDETFETHLISYHPNYNFLQQETTYTLENGMFVENFENGNTLVKSDGSVILNDGKRINLVLIGGEYQTNQMTTSATVRPVSTSTKYLSLTATGPDPSITIPTTIPADDPALRTWKSIVTENGGISGIRYDMRPNGPNAVTLELKKGQQYSIRVSKVTFGHPDSPTLKYLESEDGRTNRTAAVGTPETFTVSAHDEFGNPVNGAKIDANTSGSGAFARSNGTSVDNVATNDDGRATFTYTPADGDASNGTEVEFSIKDGSTDYETITYELDVTDTISDELGNNDVNGDGDSIVEASCSASGNATLTINNNRNHSVTIQYNGDQRFTKSLPANSITVYTSTTAITYQVTDGPGNTNRIAQGVLTCRN